MGLCWDSVISMLACVYHKLSAQRVTAVAQMLSIFSRGLFRWTVGHCLLSSSTPQLAEPGPTGRAKTYPIFEKWRNGGLSPSKVKVYYALSAHNFPLFGLKQLLWRLICGYVLISFQTPPPPPPPPPNQSSNAYVHIVTQYRRKRPKAAKFEVKRGLLCRKFSNIRRPTPQSKLLTFLPACIFARLTKFPFDRFHILQWWPLAILAKILENIGNLTI